MCMSYKVGRSSSIDKMMCKREAESPVLNVGLQRKIRTTIKLCQTDERSLRASHRTTVLGPAKLAGKYSQCLLKRLIMALHRADSTEMKQSGIVWPRTFEVCL